LIVCAKTLSPKDFRIYCWHIGNISLRIVKKQSKHPRNYLENPDYFTSFTIRLKSCLLITYPKSSRFWKCRLIKPFKPVLSWKNLQSADRIILHFISMDTYFERKWIKTAGKTALDDSNIFCCKPLSLISTILKIPHCLDSDLA